jgi:vancomycin resistance protein VanJ
VPGGAESTAGVYSALSRAAAKIEFSVAKRTEVQMARIFKTLRFKAHHARRALRILVLLILALLALAYAIDSRRWWTEALSVWPSWFWLPGFAALVWLAHEKKAWRWTAFLLLLIVSWTLLTSEGVLWLWPRSQRSGASDTRVARLRIVSMNIASNHWWEEPTLRWFESTDADLYCFQEAAPAPPGAADRLKQRLPDYRILADGNCVMLSRYPIEAIPFDLKAWGQQQAELTLPNGRRCRVVNVRMPLPALRLALYSSSAREEIRASHAERIAAFHGLSERMAKTLETGPVLLVGDFNTPARSSLLEGLRSLGMRDAFRAAGHGWGNTMTHEFPVARIDMVFVSPQFRPLAAWSEPNGFSDHRTVRAELSY